jgi:hypothetical protein
MVDYNLFLLLAWPAAQPFLFCLAFGPAKCGSLFSNVAGNMSPVCSGFSKPKHYISLFFITRGFSPKLFE